MSLTEARKSPSRTTYQRRARRPMRRLNQRVKQRLKQRPRAGVGDHAQ
jgi:hypothetical protein